MKGIAFCFLLLKRKHCTLGVQDLFIRNHETQGDLTLLRLFLFFIKQIIVDRIRYLFMYGQ